MFILSKFFAKTLILPTGSFYLPAPRHVPRIYLRGGGRVMWGPQGILPQKLKKYLDLVHFFKEEAHFTNENKKINRNRAPAGCTGPEAVSKGIALALDSGTLCCSRISLASDLGPS